MKLKFMRRDTKRYSKLGKNRKKLQKWRRPKGRDNKMRLKRRGYPACPSVGYRSPKKNRAVIPIQIHNVKQLEALKKNESIIIARVGAKKKIDIIKKSREMNLKILNLKGAEK
jgi:large subunit ribosomal protein L32e